MSEQLYELSRPNLGSLMKAASLLRVVAIVFLVVGMFREMGLWTAISMGALLASLEVEAWGGQRR